MTEVIESIFLDSIIFEEQMEILQDFIYKIQNAGALVGIFIAITTLLTSIFLLLSRRRAEKEISSILDAEIERLIKERNIYQSIILERPKEEKKEIVEARASDERIYKLEKDLSSLRQLLFENPEETITLPLIKKDIEMLSKEIESIRREFDNQSSLTKWFIGILISMSVGLFGLAISIILK